jgi:hypothetical protein
MTGLNRMLQAPVHACGAGDPNLLVIAGHIATEETWDTFSQAWKSQLDSARFRRWLHLHGGRANGSKNLSCPKAGEKDDSGARPSSPTWCLTHCVNSSANKYVHSWTK